MRHFLAAVVALSAAAAAGPAFALQPNDTMSAWAQAAPAERAKLLDRLPAIRGGDKPAIEKCLDAASEVAGHADLRIDQVAKACAAAKDDGDPV